MNLVFASKAPRHCRDEVEELLFFNAQQHRVRDGIINAVRQFGNLRLEDGEDGCRVRVGDQDAQTLFAFDADRPDAAPVGVVVFLRTAPVELTILHVAVNPDYSLQGRHSGVGLGVALMEKVCDIARRIVGIQKIIFFYKREVVIRL